MTDPGRQPPSEDNVQVTPSRGWRRRSPRMRTWIEWVAIVALARLAAFAIKTWLIQAFYIPSASMVPTLQVGDRILVDKVSYDLHDIHRGDIVVFSRPPADSSDPSVNDLVKRVVGLPGDSMSSVDDGQLQPGARLPAFGRQRRQSVLPDPQGGVLGDGGQPGGLEGQSRLRADQ